MPKPKSVMLAMPSYGPVEPESKLVALYCSKEHQVIPAMGGCSLLAMGFNILWCKALNNREHAGITHFAMAHSDIATEHWWIDKLIAEMDRVGADVLSAVVPLKKRGGETSTAMMDEHGLIARMNLADCHKIGPTFQASDVPCSILCVNTGLWVCDFTKPWVEQIHFEVRDSIEREQSGEFVAKNLPEDWNFSIQCARLGVKVFATTLLSVTHFGREGYSNRPQDSTQVAE